MKDQELKPDEEWAVDKNGNYIYEDENIHYKFDERYVQYFCDNPSQGKAESLRKAGYTGKYAKQEAGRIHKRLQARIEKQLDDQVLDGAHIGHAKLVHLCNEAESEAVQAKVAKDLIDFAGRKAGERITVSHEMSDEERDEEILQLQREIAEQEGTGRKLDS